MKNCSIVQLTDACFLPLKHLKVLNLEGNTLLQSQSNLTGRSLAGLSQLEHLNLDNCAIGHLNADLLTGLTSLKYLSLAKNSISYLDGNSLGSSTAALISIDLSDNAIGKWDERIFANSPNLKTANLSGNNVTHVSPAMIDDFFHLEQVNLTDNALHCDCHLKLLNRFNDSSAAGLLIVTDGVCSAADSWQNRSILAFLQDNRVADLCENNMTSVLVAVALLVSMLLLAAAMGYIYRFHIQYYALLWRHRTPVGGHPTESRPNYLTFNYDAFVSYSNEDRTFVVSLVDELENRAAPHKNFRLCIYERDFTAGTVLNECILDSIAVSRKVILVVSRSFVRSQWCRWEMHLAQQSLLQEGRRGLILVVLNDLKQSALPPKLRVLMKTRIYLKWDADDPMKQRLFWTRLRNALQSSP